MGHKGPVLRLICIGPGRARTQILFYSILENTYVVCSVSALYCKQHEDVTSYITFRGFFCGFTGLCNTQWRNTKVNAKVTSASACWGAAVDSLRHVAVVSVTTSLRQIRASPAVLFLFTILFLKMATPLPNWNCCTPRCDPVFVLRRRLTL